MCVFCLETKDSIFAINSSFVIDSMKVAVLNSYCAGARELRVLSFVSNESFRILNS